MGYDPSKFPMHLLYSREALIKHRKGTAMKRLPGKTRIVRGVTYLGFSCIFFILGCKSGPPASSPAADEAAVRQTDENWSKAAQSKKVDDWAAFYAKDAVLLPPNDKKVDSQEGIRKYIGELLAAPGLARRRGGQP